MQHQLDLNTYLSTVSKNIEDLRNIIASAALLKPNPDLSQIIEGAVHVKKQIVPINEHSFLNIFPKLPEFQLLHNVLIDPISGLCQDDSNTIHPLSLLEFVWWHDGFISKGIAHRPITRSDVEEEVKNRLNKATAYFGAQTKNKKLKKLGDKKIYVSLLHPFGWYAFGHLLDTLQKLYTFRREGFDPKDCVFLISDTNRISDFDNYLKTALDSDEFEVLNIKDHKDSILQVNNALLLHPLAFPAQFYSKESFYFVYDAFKRHFRSLQRSNSKSLKLFLTRLPPGSRHIVNHERLHAKLIEKNITIIDGTEPQLKLYNYFSNASHICGYHGSLFLNHIFSSRRTKVLEYCSDKRKDYSIAQKYCLVENYYQKFIQADASHNASISEDEVLRFYDC